MAKNRDVISEIKSKRTRSGYWHQYAFSERFSSIDSLIKRMDVQLQPGDQEILRTIPFATIGVVESHFRGLYATIIDKETTYLSNALKIVNKQNLKFDPEYLVAIQNKKVSIGDIISHVLKLNNLDDIQHTICELLGIDFLGFYKSYKYENVLEEIVLYSRAKTPEECIASLNKMFELRHIVAHEFALHLEIKKEEILQHYENVKSFVAATSEMIEKHLRLHIGYTQTDMNLYFLDLFEESEKQLSALLERIKKAVIPGSYNWPVITDPLLFDAAIVKWKEFREAYAKVSSHENEGGSMYTTAHCSVLAQQTKYFIGNLEDEYKAYLEDKAN